MPCVGGGKFGACNAGGQRQSYRGDTPPSTRHSMLVSLSLCVLSRGCRMPVSLCLCHVGCRLLRPRGQRNAVS